MQLVSNKDLQSELERRLIDAKIELARRSFYAFCQLLCPEFYTVDRTYLKKLCDTLQNFYERKLLKSNGKHYEGLIVQIPPRHGKTRTLTMFNTWAFGKNPKLKVLASAFTDDLANDFSRYTRDMIAEEKNVENQIVFSDIFPDTRLKHGAAAVEKWALEGSYFSYKGAGVGGQVTGKGGDILLIDDPIKSAEMAFNEPALNKLWLWYTSTWLSRKEPNALQIIVNTPWCKKDICGRILASEYKENWYEFTIPACTNETEKTMLCDTILDYEHYVELSLTVDELIFAANYRMQRLDAKGLLYKTFQTYKTLPAPDGRYKGEKMICDPAGQGDCFFTAIYGQEQGEFFFVRDVIYTQKDVGEVEDIAAAKLKELQTQMAHIEDNGLGHNYAYIIKKTLNEKYKYKFTNFISFNSTKNKEGRIFANSSEVNKRIIFPENWKYKWPEFYKAVMEYSREGKNAFNDAPDCLTNIIMLMKGTISLSREVKQEIAARAEVDQWS